VSTSRCGPKRSYSSTRLTSNAGRIEESPVQEQEELRELFVARGIEAELAKRLSVDLMRDPEMALRTHAREELGVDPSTTGSPWGAAISSLCSFAIGRFVPYCRDRDLDGNPVVWSIVLAVLAAAVVGGVIGWFTRNGIFKWAFRQVLVGALAAAVSSASADSSATTSCGESATAGRRVRP